MKYLPTFILTLMIIFPDTTSAADGLVTCDGVDCNMCSFVEMGNNIIQWLIGVLMVAFAVLAVSAGFGLVTSGGNPEAKTTAKKKMANAFIGLIIVLAAWLMIDTGMKALLNGGDGELNNGVITSWGPWNKIDCVAPAAVAVTGTSPTGAGLLEADVLSALNSEGINVVSSGSCYDPANPSCTGLAGMQESTLDSVISINSACPTCGIVITAGTEVGHSNSCHQDGTCADIDCRPNDCTISQISQINSAAQSSGNKVVFETMDCVKRDAARAVGTTAYCQSDPNYGHITGEHFSLY